MVEYSKCGRDFGEAEIEEIQQIVKDRYETSRCRISREVCKALDWYGENGKPKEWVCRELLTAMDRDGVIELPPPKAWAANRFKSKGPIDFSPPAYTFTGTVKNQGPITITRTTAGRENALWDHLVSTYHYLGYRGQMGRFLKYIAWSEDVPIACLGWAGAALKVECRDSTYGISDESRYEAIKHVANNFRFLILPWVKVKYLASHLLSRNAVQVRDEWARMYGSELTLLETFVEQDRFKGTSYRAANWKRLGETKGYGKTKRSYARHNVKKDVYVYELSPHARRGYGL